MAAISRYPLVRHARSEPTMHTLQYRRGTLRRSGRGLAFWFRPTTAGVVEIPIDDRDVTFVFHARTLDFQDLIVQGVLTYRVVDPVLLAERVDFTIDLVEGVWRRTPLEQLAGLLTQLAQQSTLDLIAQLDLRSAVREGVGAVRAAVTEAVASGELATLGVEVTTVRVTSVRPESEVEQALQTPLREVVQQQADEATFARRAQAVDKERAIAENELANRLELTRREQELITQQGANERRRAEEDAAAGRVRVQSEAEQARLTAGAKADTIREIGAAEGEAEQARINVYRDLPIEILLGLAGRELATKLERIDHLNLGGDALGGLLTNLLTAGTRRLEGGEVSS